MYHNIIVHFEIMFIYNVYGWHNKTSSPTNEGLEYAGTLIDLHNFPKYFPKGSTSLHSSYSTKDCTTHIYL